MTSIFADTSYYIAFFGPRDRHHDKAVELGHTLKRSVIVTEFVLLELGGAMVSSDDRRLFTGFLRYLQSEPDTLIVPASRELFQRGFELFAARRDKHWSLTDCTSFVVMKEYDLSDALTTDHHFEQAGFNVLLK
jgi:predicted nucleic acid-binding protein